MKHRLLLVATALILLAGCKKDPTPGYDFGKNRFTTQVDGDVREFYVDVPESYTEDVPIPVVFMLHGTSGDGLKFYNISGWKEVGAANNILTVYPSSWHYCVIDEGQVLNTTKWHSYPGAFSYCTGETPRDDIKFLRQVYAFLVDKFTVDQTSVYLAGFSNGGQMAARCAVEMSDIFAAVAECAGSFPTDTTCLPLNQIPTWFEIGNLDQHFLNDSITNIPMQSFEWAINESGFGAKVVNSHLSTFGYDTAYVITGDTNTALTARYGPTTALPAREFKFTLVKGLDHQYPNGINHPMKGAEEQWAWFKNYHLH